MAQLVYIDETGSPGTKGAKAQPYLTLVAVLVDEGKVQELVGRMRQVASAHLGWLPDGFEFHGNEIWDGRNWWEGKTPTQLLAAYADAVRLLAELDLGVAHSSIYKQGLHDRHGGTADGNAYVLALQFLLEKVDALPGNKVVICDEKREEQTRAISMLSDMQHSRGGEVPGRAVKRIIDSLHFVRSKESPGVQMADLTAYILQRSRRSKESHPAAATGLAAMREVVNAQTLTWRAPWPPPSGSIAGA